MRLAIDTCSNRCLRCLWISFDAQASSGGFHTADFLFGVVASLSSGISGALSLTADPLNGIGIQLCLGLVPDSLEDT